MQRIIIFLVLINSSINLLSQNLTYTAGNAVCCKGDTISVPVMVNGFSNICAVGVRIMYDTTRLQYVSCNSINPAIAGADYARVRQYVTLGWFSPNRNIIANIADGNKIFDVKFKCLKEETSEIGFEPNGCIASDCELNELKINKVSGKIAVSQKCK